MKRVLLVASMIGVTAFGMSQDKKNEINRQMNSGPVRTTGRPSTQPNPYDQRHNPNEVPRIGQGCNIQ